MARPSLNRATGVGIATNNPDQSPSSGTGRAVLNVRLNGPGRRTRGIEVSPVRPALPKLLRTSRTAVDPQGQCECCGIPVPWRDVRRRQFFLAPSGRRCTRLVVVSAQGHDETLKVGNRHGQRRMTASSKSRWHLLLKMDADARTAVRAKCQTVGSTRQASPDSRPPAVVLGQMRPDDVTQGSHDLKEAEGCDE